MRFRPLLRIHDMAEAQVQLSQCLAESGFQRWKPGDPISSAPIRILIGMATWSAYDLALMDDLSEVQLDSSQFQIDVFSFDEWTKETLDTYIPALRIETIYHCPVVGVWRLGEFQESMSGGAAKFRVRQLCGLPLSLPKPAGDSSSG